MTAFRWMAAAAACVALAASGARTDELMQKSGLNAQIAQFEKLVLRGVEEGIADSVQNRRGKDLTAEERAQLRSVVSSSFNTQRLRGEVRASLGKTLSPADEAAVLAWLDTDLGRRIAAIDVKYAEITVTMPERQLVGQVSDARKGLTETRVALLRRLGSALALGEASTRTITSILTSIMYGVMSSLDLSVADVDLIKRGLEARRDNIAHAMRQGAVARYAHQYKSLEDEALERFVNFVESPTGLKYSDATAAALEQAISHAALDFGRQFGEISKARKQSGQGQSAR